MAELESRSPAETERIAAELAGALDVGDVVTVAGTLGAGKTTFVRGACRALGVTTPVSSPTYAIGNRYHGRTDVSHLDLYRLDSISEDDWGDLEEYFDGAIVFVEWPEAAQDFLPTVRARVRLRLVDAERRLIDVQNA
jgi:tRNA threonylcarbamoyladenosine biosynthesis protein TsaE